MKRIYIEEWVKFDSKYKKTFVILSLLFVLLATIMFFISVNNEDITQKWVMSYVDSLGGKEKLAELTKNDWNTFLEIFINNIKVSAIVLILGLVPFLLLPFIIFVPNGLMIGAALGFSFILNRNPLVDFAVGILPHGIIEFTAIFLVTTLSLKLSVMITKKLIFFKKGTSVNFIQEFIGLLKTYVYVCLPLFLIGAFVETYITPLIMSMVR